MAEKIRKHIIFFGRVQGVGFRYYSSNWANANELTGWVMNREDGTVEMEVQGASEKIDKLIQYMEQRDYVMIERMVQTVIPLAENEWEFRERGW